MWRLRGRGLRALGLVATVVAGAGLAVLIPMAEGPDPTAHGQLEGVAEPGMIVVADTGNYRFQVFYPDGTFAFKFGHGGVHGHAQSIDIAPDGRIVLSASGYHGGVHMFKPNGTYGSIIIPRGDSVGHI